MAKKLTDIKAAFLRHSYSVVIHRTSVDFIDLARLSPAPRTNPTFLSRHNLLYVNPAGTERMEYHVVPFRPHKNYHLVTIPGVCATINNASQRSSQYPLLHPRSSSLSVRIHLAFSCATSPLSVCYTYAYMYVCMLVCVFLY